MSDADPPGARPNLATGVAGLLVSLGAVGFVFADPTELVSTLTLVLVVTATVAELISARYASRYVVSGAFLCGVLAIAFVGPAAGFAVPLIAISVAWVFERYRWRALLITLAGAGPPTMAIGFAFEALSLDQDSTGFLAALAVAGLVVFACSVFVVVPLMAVLDGQPILSSLRGFVGIAPTVAINIAALVFLAGIYVDIGLSALAFVLLLIVAFSYMARLVAEARARTREYASLSWGVLSGLIRTLDERDSRAARHCAAVAAFSRDIAKHVADIADKYLIPGEVQSPAIMFVPSESIYADLHDGFADVIQKAHRAQVMVVSPNILMLAINTVQTVMKDARMREQADLIRQEVGTLLNDVRLLGERVTKLQSHFNQADADIKNILISTGKIVSRGEKIEKVELAPAQPPKSLP